MSDLLNIDSHLPTLRDKNLANVLLYGNHINVILMHAIRYIKDSQRFNLVNPS